MAIKFEKPKTKIHSNSKRTKRLEERIAFLQEKAYKRKMEYLMPQFKDKVSKVERKRRLYAWHRSMGKIYPEVSLKGGIHPLMYKFWLYLKNYNNAYDKDKKQHIDQGDLVKWGVARLVWFWVYNNMPWPVGCKGGKPKKNMSREAIITQIATQLLDDTIEEEKKRRKPAMSPTARRQYYRLKAKAKAKALAEGKAQDDKEQTGPTTVPTV